MIEDGYAKLDDDLKSLSQRIEKPLRELKQSGRLSDDFEGAANEIRAHQQRLRDRVVEAIRSGSEWSIMKAEFARDYSALFDNALRFERRIDEEFAKNRR